MIKDLDALRVLVDARPDSLDTYGEATRCRVLDAALSTAAIQSPRARRRTRPMVRAAVGVSALAAVVVAALALQSTPTSEVVRTQPHHVPASRVGHTAHETAPAAAGPVLVPLGSSGRYWYTSLRTMGIETDRWTARSTADASWLTLRAGSGPPMVHRADPSDTGSRGFEVEGRLLTFSDVEGLPTDPVKLRQFLFAPYPADYQRAHRLDFIQRLFGEVLDLTLAPAQPAVRAAAYQLMTEFPEVHTLGQVTDVLGRVGTGVALSDGAVEHQLIIDRATRSVLATEDVTRTGGQLSVKLANVIVQSGWTDSHPSREEIPVQGRTTLKLVPCHQVLPPSACAWTSTTVPR